MPTFAYNTALLIIDVPEGFDDATRGRHNNSQTQQRITDLHDTWRTRNAPVIHLRRVATDRASPLRPGQQDDDFKARPAALLHRHACRCDCL
jgi:nicotinamidase-related amidase